ncbi:hypothetical protein BV25DRAFT_1914521 [Artomyces pyxidatus]|uniref:Uncharacterized protein n=1 Tax=Artomyces pyxidatus TaxID=48021 RepID=A0ACB8T6I6_9AGAM|nr:hypothetical protein BV25DRAFT_1914521 [Artomyces pyxidatus]
MSGDTAELLSSSPLTHNFRSPYTAPGDQKTAHMGTVETINSIILVSTFVAGVQAQILASTYVKNQTTLNVVTNVFGFVGLTLDLLGTSAGAAQAISTRQSMARTEDILQHIARSLSEAQSRGQRLEELARRDYAAPSAEAHAEVYAILTHISRVIAMLEAPDDDGTMLCVLLQRKLTSAPRAEPRTPCASGRSSTACLTSRAARGSWSRR